MDAQWQAALDELRGELDGSPEHDREVLSRWAERYRGNPEAYPLLKEIGRLLFGLDAEENASLGQNALDSLRSVQERTLGEARRRVSRGKPGEALEMLAPAVKRIDQVPLSEDYVWMDFGRFLDGLLYQDYFSEEIGGREILRHPLQPGALLYLYGSLLIQLDRAEEAVEPLLRLVSLDPVCPKYLFELGEAYKRTGQLDDAYQAALLALHCAADGAELARAYRDIAFCLFETGVPEDAAALYRLSLR